ncbi:MAG: TatD family hydrolase [Candidatus Methanospirareceae archaeon]
MVKIIDIHCHLTFKQYDEDREKVIEEAREELKAVVTSGVEPKDAEEAVKLAEKHKNFIFATLGLHPIHVHELESRDIERYEEFISENERKIIGIGEIGLDYYWIREPMKIKRIKEVFKELLRLAKELDLPVILHLRGEGALEEGLKIVIDEDIKKAVFHCFSGKMSVAESISEENYYVSLPASIVRSKSMKKVAKKMPISLLLAETDAPYLSPEGAEKRNVPQNVKVVYEEIARQRKEDIEVVKKEIEKNFLRLFQGRI